MSKKRACAEAGSICGPKKSKLVDASSKLELLPDPQTMSHEVKAISSKMKNAFHTMDELDLFNQSKKCLDKISEDSENVLDHWKIWVEYCASYCIMFQLHS